MESDNNGIRTEITSTNEGTISMPRRSLRFRIIKWSCITFASLVVFPVCLVAILAYGLYHLDEQTGMVSKAFDLPDFNQKVSTPLAYTSVLTDRDGEQLSCYTKEHRVTVDIKLLKEKNPQLIKAIIASEDSRFLPDENWYWRAINYFTGPIVRPGYDLKGIFHAAVTDIAAGRIVAGGSTVEQQIVKNKMLSSKRVWSRKLAEVFLAVKLKQHLSPDEILQMYVDLVFIGGPYGVGAAAPAYFGKPAEAISLDQAAILAGMINNSEALVTIHSDNPVKRTEAIQRIRERRDRVLRLMLEHEYISGAEYMVAANAQISPAQFKGACEKKEQFVAEMVRTTYEPKFGNLHTGGYRFVSTLKPQVQRSAKEACEASLAQYLKRHPENRSTMQCNTLVVDITNGEVLALIGGQNFKVREVNGVTYDKTHPGSAFKPFLYAAYLEHLLFLEKEKHEKRMRLAGQEETPEAGQAKYDLLSGCKVSDFHNVLVPAIIGSTRDRVVTRKLINNYPEERRKSYMGIIPCTVALASSQNSGTMWAEGELAPRGTPEAERWRRGTDAVIEMSERLGITSQLRQTVRLPTGETVLLQSPTVPLGFNDVSLWELSEAYLPFFNGGCRGHLTLIHSITDLKGATIEGGGKKDCERVLDPNVVRGMRKMLQEVVDNEFGTGHSLRAKKLFLEGDLAGKTGTATKSDGVRVESNLYIGATPRYLIATRVSNIDRAALGSRETGARNALPVFRDILIGARLFSPTERFPAIPDLAPGEVFVPPTYNYEALHPEIIAQKKKMAAIDERRKAQKAKKPGRPVLRLDESAALAVNPSKQKPKKP